MAGCCGEGPAPPRQVQESEFCSVLGVWLRSWHDGKRNRLTLPKHSDWRNQGCVLGMCVLLTCQVKSRESVAAPEMYGDIVL